MGKNRLSAYLCLKGFATEISNLFYVGQIIPVKLIHIYIYKKKIEPGSSSLLITDLKNPSITSTAPRHLCTHLEIILN